MATTDMAKLTKKYVSHFNACTKDSDRLASLMLLGKLMSKPDCSDEMRRDALQLLDLSFVGRMLNSNSTVLDEDGTCVSLQGVALSIMQRWASDPELMATECFLRLLHPIGQIVSGGSEDPTCIADAYLCLRLLLDDVSGRVAILERDVVPLLCKAIIEDKHDFQKSVDILKYLSQCHEGVLWDLHAVQMHQVMARLANPGPDSQAVRKFPDFDSICVLLRGLESIEFEPEWLVDLSTSLLNAFKSKLDEGYRRMAIRLAGELTRLWSFDWLRSRPQEEVHLLVQLSAIETSVLVEYSVTSEKTDPHADVLIATFTILEAALQWLSSPSSSSSSSDRLSRLIGPLEEAFSTLSRMLVRWSDSGETSILAIAAVRVLGAWLSQEDWTKSEAERLSVDLLLALRKLGERSLDSGEELLCFILPALCLTSAELEQRRVLEANGWPAILVRYLLHRLDAMDHMETVCSGVNVFLNFLLDSHWLPEVQTLLNIIIVRWNGLMALGNVSLSLHLTLLASAAMQLRPESLGERGFLHLVDSLLSVFERDGRSFRRLPAVDKEWDEVGGLWLLAMQIITDSMEKRVDLVRLLLGSGYATNIDSIVEGLNCGDSCYKSVAAMKAVLNVSPSP